MSSTFLILFVSYVAETSSTFSAQFSFSSRGRFLIRLGLFVFFPLVGFGLCSKCLSLILLVSVVCGGSVSTRR